MSLHRLHTRQVLARLMGGGSSPVVVETQGGRFVAKLRGAGHGVRALIAEIVVAGIAEKLGLPVPERALIELDPAYETADKNDELSDLLQASLGLNLGFRYLEGAKELGASQADRDFALHVLWLDGLTMNADRTTTNPNILVWHGGPWLIDHGSALPFHHYWAQISEADPREATSYVGHVFEAYEPALPEVDQALASALTREALQAILMEVPEAFLSEAGPDSSPERSRAAYEAFLWKRLKPPRPFVRRSR